MASFGSCVQVRHGATCRKTTVPAPLVTIVSFGGGGLASGTGAWMPWPPGRFIVRNSWGTAWGDGGFAYASEAYINAAFYEESYGMTL